MFIVKLKNSITCVTNLRISDRRDQGLYKLWLFPVKGASFVVAESEDLEPLTLTLDAAAACLPKKVVPLYGLLKGNNLCT